MVVVESDGACGCFEEVKSSRESRGDSWVQVGSGKGAYERVTSLKFVGAGKGSIDKEVVSPIDSAEYLEQWYV